MDAQIDPRQADQQAEQHAGRQGQGLDPLEGREPGRQGAQGQEDHGRQHGVAGRKAGIGRLDRAIDQVGPLAPEHLLEPLADRHPAAGPDQHHQRRAPALQADQEGDGQQHDQAQHRHRAQGRDVGGGQMQPLGADQAVGIARQAQRLQHRQVERAGVALGHLLGDMQEGQQPAGRHHQRGDGAQLASGGSEQSWEIPARLKGGKTHHVQVNAQKSVSDRRSIPEAPPKCFFVDTR